MHVRFKIMQGSNKGKDVPIPKPKCLIGRGEDCHLRPQSDAISRHHCAIITSENEVIVRDLKSRNGTFVNEEQVTGDAVLLNGVGERLGDVLLADDIRKCLRAIFSGYYLITHLKEECRMKNEETRIF